MTEITGQPQVDRESTQDRVRDWSAVAGIAFAPLFIAAFMVTPGSPHYSYRFASDQKWQDWATDTGYGQRYLLSVYLLMVASLALVVFVTGLARRIRIARGEASLAAGSVFGLGLLGAGLIAAGSVAWNTGPIFFLFDDDLAEQMNREIYAHIWMLGHLLIFVGMTLAVAAVIGVVASFDAALVHHFRLRRRRDAGGRCSPSACTVHPDLDAHRRDPAPASPARRIATQNKLV